MTEEVEGLVWHYTDTAGLIGMLTKHELWASSTSFMNDPQEDEYALDLLAEAFKGLPRGLGARAASRFEDFRRNDLYAPSAYSKRFVACASQDGDLLEMWRAYGATGVEGTFAVGLDMNVPLGVIDESDHAGLCRPSMSTWKEVEYSDPGALAIEARERLRIGLLGCGQDDVAAEWDVVDKVLEHLQHVAKAPAYAAEREVRLTVEAPEAGSESVQLRASRFGPVPYLRLTGGVTDWGAPIEGAWRLPVRAITLWPGAPQQALLGVIAALDQGDHSHRRSRNGAFMDTVFSREEDVGAGRRKITAVDIRTSTIPFV